MLKKTITYTDYNGVVRTEDFYFNLNKAEIAEKELSYEGGYAEMLRRIVKAKDQAQLVKIFKGFILEAYGEKSVDGKRFIKSEELSTAFSQTEAYSILYMELVTDDVKAADFIKNVFPADVREKAMAAALAEQN